MYPAKTLSACMLVICMYNLPFQVQNIYLKGSTLTALEGEEENA